MQRQSSNLLKRTLDEIAERTPSFGLREELERLVISLVEEYRPDTVMLTGSLARGGWVSGSSDVDLLIVTERARSIPYLDRFRLRSIDGVDVNITIFTKNEVIEGVKSLSFFFINALDGGVPLYGAESFSYLKSVMAAESEKLKLVKVGKGWAFRV